MDYFLTVKCSIVEKLKGKVFKVPRNKADDIYAKERETFIPLAEKYANDKCGIVFNGPQREREAWCRRWNTAFISKMDELCRESGLLN